MLKKPIKLLSFYFIFFLLLSQLVSCRDNSLAIGVVFKHRWSDSGLATKSHILAPHSRSIKKITIHHTATRNGIGKSDIDKLRSTRRYHIERRGWGDIAYHYLIAADGTIYQGRSEQFRGGSSIDYGLNNNLLIALMGNFELEQPTEQALESLKKLINNRLIHHNISPKNVYTHRDHVATLCPGAKLQSWLNNVGMNQIIDNYNMSRW